MTIERIPGCAIPRVCESRVATTDCATIGPSTSCRIDPRDLRLQTAVQAPAQLFASRVASSTPAAHAAKRVLAQQMRLLQRRSSEAATLLGRPGADLASVLSYAQRLAPILGRIPAAQV